MQNYSNHKWQIILFLFLNLTPHPVWSEDFSASIKNVNFTFQDAGYKLNATLDYHLSPTAKKALHKGIPLTWIVYVKIQQPGFIWDTTLKELTLSYQIRNHALLNLYSVKKSSDNSNNTFSSLTAALNFMSNIRNISLIEKRQLQVDKKYPVAIKISFDREALPTPLRPMSYFNSQWALSSPWSLWQLQN